MIYKKYQSLFSLENNIKKYFKTMSTAVMISTLIIKAFNVCDLLQM